MNKHKLIPLLLACLLFASEAQAFRPMAQWAPRGRLSYIVEASTNGGIWTLAPGPVPGGLFEHGDAVRFRITIVSSTGSLAFDNSYSFTGAGSGAWTVTEESCKGLILLPTESCITELTYTSAGTCPIVTFTLDGASGSRSFDFSLGGNTFPGSCW